MTSPNGSNTPVIHVIPAAPGPSVCSYPVLCIQRVTSIVNNEANVEAWAYDLTWKGHFQLIGPDGPIANSKGGDKIWYAGGQGYTFPGVAKGAGYTMIAWQVQAGGHSWSDIGSVGFSV